MDWMYVGSGNPCAVCGRPGLDDGLYRPRSKDPRLAFFPPVCKRCRPSAGQALDMAREAARNATR